MEKELLKTLLDEHYSLSKAELEMIGIDACKQGVNPTVPNIEVLPSFYRRVHGKGCTHE